MQNPRTPGIRAWLPWAIAGVATLALVVVLARQSDGDASSRQVQQLQERLERIEQGAAAPAGSAGASGRAPVSATRPGAGRDNASFARFRSMTPEQRAEEIERQRKALDAEFRADTPDPGGSRGTVTHLEDTVVGKDMAATGLAPEDVAVDCRKTLCKVSARFARSGDAEDWAIMYLSAAGGEIERAQTVHVRQPDGSTQVIIYGTRGTRLQR